MIYSVGAALDIILNDITHRDSLSKLLGNIININDSTQLDITVYQQWSMIRDRSSSSSTARPSCIARLTNHLICCCFIIILLLTLILYTSMRWQHETWIINSHVPSSSCHINTLAMVYIRYTPIPHRLIAQLISEYTCLWIFAPFMVEGQHSLLWSHRKDKRGMLNTI